MIRINVQDIFISNLYLLLLQIPSTRYKFKTVRKFPLRSIENESFLSFKQIDTSSSDLKETFLKS